MTGVVSVVGKTGLADCSTPTSPCGPTSANTLGALGGNDLCNRFSTTIYLKSTRSTNPDGSFNFYDEGLFGAGGKLYATFDTGTFNPKTSVITPVIAPNLYRMDPSTGIAPLVAPPTTLGLGAVVDVSATPYPFSDTVSQVVTLDLANGSTTFFSKLQPGCRVH